MLIRGCALPLPSMEWKMEIVVSRQYLLRQFVGTILPIPIKAFPPFPVRPNIELHQN